MHHLKRKHSEKMKLFLCQFLRDLNKTEIERNSENPIECYDQITDKHLAVLSKQAPLKKIHSEKMIFLSEEKEFLL